MAEKKPGKKAKGDSFADRIEVKIQPELKPDTPTYYINYASVSRSEYDFSIMVLHTPNQLTPEQTELARSGASVPFEPLLQLIIPPRLIDGLVRALSEQKEKYENEFGLIRQEKLKSDKV